MSETNRKRIFVCLTLCLLGGLLATNIATRRTAAQVSEVTGVVEVSHAAPIRSSPAPRFWLASHKGIVSAKSVQAAPSQADKPVEQTRKNIQVLKGLPESQMFPLMNSISASLGVRCGFCHVKQGKDPKTGFDNWVWESDDKPEKKTARRMMQMTLSLNATNKADFRDNAVTCYTCHRGKNDPVGIPTLPLAVSGHEEPAIPPAGNAGARPTDTRPTVEQIFSKYADAVGGKFVLAKLQTRTLKGTYEATQNRSFPIELTFKGPDKYTYTVTTPGGVAVRTINGNTGWVKTQQGVHAMTPTEVSEVKHAAQLYDLVKVSMPKPEMRVRRRIEKIGERDAYVVESREGDTVERLYFDKETGLLLRKYTLTSTVLNPIPEQVDYEDYRDVDGVKVPFVIRTSEIDTYYSSLRRFTEIKHNVPVNDALFAIPSTPPK